MRLVQDGPRSRRTPARSRRRGRTAIQIRELKIPGTWEITPKQFLDDRKVFLETCESSAFEKAIGHRLDLRQANVSVSRAGIVRGIHFTDVPSSQAKYVVCPCGTTLNFAIDIRIGSPTFGRRDSVLLGDVGRRAIYLSEGLGHVFIALEGDPTVMYVCLVEYAPGREHGVSSVCPEVALGFPKTGRDGSLLELLPPEKDTATPDLAEARESGSLPTWDAVQAYLTTL